MEIGGFGNLVLKTLQLVQISGSFRAKSLLVRDADCLIESHTTDTDRTPPHPPFQLTLLGVTLEQCGLGRGLSSQSGAMVGCHGYASWTQQFTPPLDQRIPSE